MNNATREWLNSLSQDQLYEKKYEYLKQYYEVNEKHIENSFDEVFKRERLKILTELISILEVEYAERFLKK